LKRSADAAKSVTSPLVLATAGDGSEGADALPRARAFAEPLLAHEMLETAENTLAHADAVAAILADLGASQAMQAASYLVYAANHLNRPAEAIARGFGEGFAKLAIETNKLVGVQRQAQAAQASALLAADVQAQTETVRKMLLAFSRDLRVVLLRLASRLQTLRHYAATKLPVPQHTAQESLHVFSPLANRLGIWQIKWEIEDLSFRFLEPDTYKTIAHKLEDKRAERESYMAELRSQLATRLATEGVTADVQGRPKHIYSIIKKMRGKGLNFEQVFDVRALRVIVRTQDDCYAALARIHTWFTPVAQEFDDYIAKPKPNGYQSLHTIVRDDSAAGRSRPVEIQIRTHAMHEHAEFGVAAHWAYKEAGAKGYAGVSAASAYDAKIAVLRQLLAWERETAAPTSHDPGQALATDELTDRIYVLTPDAAVIELAKGATAIDFAYAVHTNLGHRCRGAKLDGVMVPLTTPLQNGQTVEVTALKEGGPSRDWLNPELGFLATSRAKAKVRAWFNAQVAEETAARGRDWVEKVLQREGKTATKHDDLAHALGFKNTELMFEAAGKDELSARQIETVLRPAQAQLELDDYLLQKKQKIIERKRQPKPGVLVVGVDSLMTQLAKCCKPAPPDEISGFVTRGKGVSIHRTDCSNFKQMATKHADRVIDVEWGLKNEALYPVDVGIQAQDRQGLLRDISEVFAREKCNVIGVQTQTVNQRTAKPSDQSFGQVAWMTFTVEVSDASKLVRVLGAVRDVSGVQSVRRK
jgi:GTP pyrophosphokinase